MTITHDDLRAATAAGVVTEEQAARLSAMAHERAGRISRQASEDEPFELFPGFAEIFISLGLILVTNGLIFLAAVAGGTIAVMIALIIIGWLGAQYFTLKRRMSLPSIVLVCTFAIGVGGLIGFVLDNLGPDRRALARPSVRPARLCRAGGPLPPLPRAFYHAADRRLCLLHHPLPHGRRRPVHPDGQRRLERAL